MLKIFRKKIVSRIILWGLLILILPAFVMWGSASMSRSKDKGPSYVGIIDNRKISFEEFYTGLSGVRTQVILNYFNQPKVLDSILGNKGLMAKLAWDRLILLNETKKLRIRVPDKEIIEALQKHPLFVRDGAFDQNFYSYVLRNNIGLEPRAFEEIVRNNIAIQKLSSYFTKDLKISDEELLSEYKKDLGKVKIEYILVEPKNYFEEVKIGDNAAKEFYDAHKNELVLKPNIKGAAPDRIATFDESRETIEKHLKTVEARKILKGKAEEIHKKLAERLHAKNGAFSKAVEDIGLAAKNTDFFSRTDVLEDIGNIPVVAESAYELKDFELSKPVEIDKGFLIFEVVERKSADEESFKKEKDEFAKKLRERRTNILMENWLRNEEAKANLAIKLEDVEKYYK